ncbi:MAG: leucyl/phenylalanyl-tRNA--protein transferase [Bacteroidales bacterium]|nr:leucyl/phenylalanyl-tRNA--protein transferase [Bacteroidales bacterium]
MIYRLDPHYPGFPNPEESEPDGLIAIGGDLSPERLINAYCCGIFPWYNEGEPLLWWSLDPRMVLYPDELRVSKSLRRVVKSGKYEVRIDSAFEQTMRNCGNVDRTAQGQTGTWITEAMVAAYVRLHEMGLVHSFETYFQGQMVGGLYGVSIGPFFFGESMFHTMPDASKVALVRLVEFCKAHQFLLIDAQQETPHLASMGARPIPRSEYLPLLNQINAKNSLIGNWHNL